MRKPVRLEIVARNNNLLRAMEEYGIRSAAELCREIYSSDRKLVGSLINMKVAARSKNGGWLSIVLRLSEFFKCMPEDLFSEEQQYGALSRNKVRHAELDFCEIQGLILQSRNAQLSPDNLAAAREVKKRLQTLMSRRLNPNENEVLRLRFGLAGEDEHTLEQIGDILNVTRQRVCDMEATALKKLRGLQVDPNTHPLARAGALDDKILACLSAIFD